MFTLQIETDNAAFEDNPSEVEDIVRHVADALAQGYTEGSVRDTNGNTVGRWTLLP